MDFFAISDYLCKKCRLLVTSSTEARERPDFDEVRSTRRRLADDGESKTVDFTLKTGGGAIVSTTSSVANSV